MPVVEFALDPAAQHRIQLHVSTEQTAITVMLNSSILGSLTPEEQAAGKDFPLPDSSSVHVRVYEGQPQVSRGGYPLPIVDPRLPTIDISPAAIAQRRDKKLSGRLIVWLVSNIVLVGGLTIPYLRATLVATAIGISPLPFLVYSLLGVVGVVGLSLIFFWKKLGFYLVAGYAVLSLLASFPFGTFDVRSFVPIVAAIALFVYLNRDDIWQKMS